MKRGNSVKRRKRHSPASIAKRNRILSKRLSQTVSGLVFTINKNGNGRTGRNNDEKKRFHNADYIASVDASY